MTDQLIRNRDKKINEVKYKVMLPFRIQCIKKGKFYVLERDEEGYARVKRFRLE